MSDALAPAPLWFRAARAVIRRLPAGRFRAFDLLARRGPPPFADRLGAEAGGFAYPCDLRHLVAREMCLTGRYAPAEGALVRDALGPGATFVDVGANLGYFSLLAAARVGAAGRVVAVEPDPRMAARLRQALAMNALAQVTVLESAAAERAGTATLDGFAEDGGNWGVSTLVASADGGRPAFQVPCAPLDALLDDIGVGAVDLVKVDVEGAETSVLRGMRDGLAAGRYRRVLAELHPWAIPGFADEFRAMCAAMEAAGYRGWLVDDSAGAARRAYYGATAPPVLRPLDAGTEPGPWPHVLWARRGMEPA